MAREVKSNLTTIIPYEVQTFSPLLQDIGIMIKNGIRYARIFPLFFLWRTLPMTSMT